jgi:hypothetical protein
VQGKTFHPGSPPNFDMPKSWDNVLLPGGKCPGPGCVQKANQPTLAQRPYVFSLNGYPKCVNETGRTDALPHSLVCVTYLSSCKRTNERTNERTHERTKSLDFAQTD